MDILHEATYIGNDGDNGFNKGQTYVVDIDDSTYDGKKTIRVQEVKFPKERVVHYDAVETFLADWDRITTFEGNRNNFS